MEINEISLSTKLNGFKISLLFTSLSRISSHLCLASPSICAPSEGYEMVCHRPMFCCNDCKRPIMRLEPCGCFCVPNSNFDLGLNNHLYLPILINHQFQSATA